jgi:hypothetical protein
VAGGIPFVADQRDLFALTSLVIDVQSSWGREGIVAYSTGFAGGC